MQLTITSVDYAPEELHEQVPLVVDLLRRIPGEDRPDYWIGAARTPIRWVVDSHSREVTHLVVAARWEGTAIGPGFRNLPIGVAYVTDPTLLEEDRLDFAKCRYVAIGIASESGGERQVRPDDAGGPSTG
jgi:hypothetical protein